MSQIQSIALDITPSEWLIMRTVWAHPFCTSREIIDTVLNLTSWKEGTIKSLISRLEKKELLIKDTTQRPYTFNAAISEQDALNATLDHLIQRTCHKKHVSLLSHLMDMMSLSKDDIQILTDQLKQQKLNAPDEVLCTCPEGQCTCHLN
ncbi:BlaI/MecI/CopY family transcriptional regulator [Dolosicoccus paucivorans]|uniref:BlaI/MecI/CopY family transcriptional regulator n=1 Tax=Dolosicoccus paucivorans TaxID=84521 RepID=A0A1G8IK44_9LACT|nr:BlaI/MecI/CopY family transcriptional regulator [Dolosicoccus paucivorans]PMB84939.1 BlaI/MecI/CopY family transcriptional regulator [Dolosicoccus paucivorans]PMC58710.1 BlaI/MecI/CopY family transcriptional regulator [Dolosicoccus paucivorans]SDI19326.1 Predicted transcriptional regulator [Dolosicoccus paucivorans]